MIQQFARAWIEAWNRHDLDAVLALYDDDFELTSLQLKRRLPQSGGRLIGKAAVRPYWQQAFAPGVDLYFEVQGVFVGVETAVIRYKGLRGTECAEFFRFGPTGLVLLSHAHEAEP